MQNKKKVILDTDICNGCDDHFALAYLLKNLDTLDVQAITLEPFSYNGALVKNCQSKNVAQVLKYCKWQNFSKEKVFKGDNNFLQDGQENASPAVQKIVSLAKENKQITILAIGALTNVAHAIMTEPEIAKKLKIVWMGGYSPCWETNWEYNFKQDICAVKVVFESEAQLVVIPSKSVASNLLVSIHDVRHYLSGKGDMCDNLIKQFGDDTYHKKGVFRSLFDLSVVAYAVNEKWFTIKEVSVPKINADTSYTFTNSKKKMQLVTFFDANKILCDMFEKLSI